MDPQKMLDAMMEQARVTRAQYHLTLGQLKETLERTPKKALVEFSDGVYPGNLDSYRGYYTDLAFDDSAEAITAGDLLKVVKQALKTTFTGYKGGDYPASHDTVLWRSEYGSASRVCIVNTHYDNFENRLTLITKVTD